MTQEDKDLLLRDLCARLPYGVKVHVGDDWAMTLRKIDYECFCECWENEDIKSNSRWMLPYLRPMSSMTEEENKEYISIWTGSIRGDMTAKIDFYIKHHFDFRLTSEGLSMIEAGLALEAPEGMYNIKEK